MTSESNKTWFDQYNEFADACGIPKGSLLDRPSFEEIALGVRLVQEEWSHETLSALSQFSANPTLENLVEVADGITDTIYVLCQLARALGIPLNQTWEEVQRSNMAKVMPDGSVRRREDGKILKPEGWTPPDIWEVLNKAREAEEIQKGAYGAENWPQYQKPHNPSFPNAQAERNFFEGHLDPLPPPKGLKG
ncbi:MAG TPA: nucleoside triphosphate pyrophosphohydrolase family protein [Allocoleopsis sp.]